MEMIDLIKCFNIRHGHVISVVGAGGKSDLLSYLGRALVGKTILMPSTKMYRPEASWPLQLNKKIEWQEPFGIDETVVTAHQELQGKLSGVNSLVFDADYDHIVIEADGSKGRPLKGWHFDEPVVIEETTLTIGIIDITSLNMPINGSTIHRLELFKGLTKTDEKISLRNLADIIYHPMGLFKNSRGKKVLFINKVESSQLMKDALELCDLLESGGCHSLLDQVIIGSVHNGLGCIKR